MNYKEKAKTMSPEVLEKAVNHFNNLLSNDEKKQLLDIYNENGKHWFTGYHFYEGMWLRNSLREVGLTDDLLPDKNWDDYYIGVLEIMLGV